MRAGAQRNPGEPAGLLKNETTNNLVAIDLS